MNTWDSEAHDVGGAASGHEYPKICEGGPQRIWLSHIITSSWRKEVMLLPLSARPSARSLKKLWTDFD